MSSAYVRESERKRENSSGREREHVLVDEAIEDESGECVRWER